MGGAPSASAPARCHASPARLPGPAKAPPARPLVWAQCAAEAAAAASPVARRGLVIQISAISAMKMPADR
ncbi:hypothetical protein SAMN05216551_103162 [Chitinasiproducens palmae]|uniref:Uncharacterized protein n=1 Tax=Chitinasiproducens palmae TaxID=1770053 RepID=A0A1H2PME3_9BURK|nr:hypothetical protein SAMN05216551_103162 [Chitinasiproducens palmae]